MSRVEVGGGIPALLLEELRAGQTDSGSFFKEKRSAAGLTEELLFALFIHPPMSFHLQGLFQVASLIRGHHFVLQNPTRNSILL